MGAEMTFLTDVIQVETTQSGYALELRFNRPVTTDDRKALRDAHNAELNTRPTHAPCGELVTVAQVYVNSDGECDQIEWLCEDSPDPDFMRLVTRQNAEAVIAAERMKLEATAKVGLQLSEKVEALEAENAAKDARIKELEADNKRLRGALETIADGNFLFPSEFRFFACAALGEVKL